MASLLAVLGAGCSSSVASSATAGFPHDGVGPRSAFCQTVATEVPTLAQQIRANASATQGSNPSASASIQAYVNEMQAVETVLGKIDAVAPADIEKYVGKIGSAFQGALVDLGALQKAGTTSGKWPTPAQISQATSVAGEAVSGQSFAESVLTVYQNSHCHIPGKFGVVQGP